MKNPTILEGGIARVFSGIRKLFTRQSGSDDMITWVPESDRTLGTKHITQNGVYRASDDGYYAYSSVTVSVPTDTGVTGEGDDGEQHYVAPDPETGELVDEVIPSSIEIVTPPTKLIYIDGETIDFTGSVVKAYLETGGEYGVVPNGEITLNPTTATYDASTAIIDAAKAYPSDSAKQRHPEYSTPISMNMPASFRIYYDNQQYPQNSFYTEYSIPTGCYVVVCNMSDGKTGVLFASKTSATLNYDRYRTNSGEKIDDGTTNLQQDSTTGYWFIQLGNYEDNVRYDTNNTYTIPYGYDMLSSYSALLDLIFSGEIEENLNYSNQTITVSWPRPGDGAILETSFDITVQQSFGGASGGGGQAGETGAGRND